MENKKLQNEILKFLNEKTRILKDIFVEFENMGYSKKDLDENLWFLTEKGEIGGSSIDYDNHIIHGPIHILKEGHEHISPWSQKLQKNLVVIIGTFSAIIAAIFSILSYFKK